MAADMSPQREADLSGSIKPVSLLHKRVLDDDHSPVIPSPLNPEFARSAQKVQMQNPEDLTQFSMARERRTKKDSLKKRESRGVTGAPESWRTTPDVKVPRPPTSQTSYHIAPIRYKLPLPKPWHFEPARPPVFTSHHEVDGPEGERIEFFQTSEHVHNKKAFRYRHCTADPTFPSMLYYRQTEPQPHAPHLSFEDAASHVYLDKTGTHITTDKGFRMARANVAIRQGCWYWECKITRGTVKNGGDGTAESHGHVRAGFARREASLDAPVGFDAYSYGIRDVAGQKVHMSRPKDLFPPGEDLREGDVLGLEMQLPSEHLHRKVVQGVYNPAVDLADESERVGTESANIVRDRIPIEFKSHIYFEQIDYHSTKDLEDVMNPPPTSSSASAEGLNPNHPVAALRTLPGSYIKVYKNGVLMGTAWNGLLAFLPPASKPPQQPGAREGLDDGMLGYYPAVSVFRGGAAQVNFGPKFWYPPPGLGPAAEGQHATGPDAVKIRPVSERYDEQIVEDIVYDMVDELGFWMEDGGKVVDRTYREEKPGDSAGAGASGRGEIKELVQDD